MPEIIALEGAAQTGKSITIGLLYNEMKLKKYKIVQDKKIAESRDFVAILQKKRKKIGITTYGSNALIIKKRINYLVNNSCEIVVCACYNSGSTKQLLQNYPADLKIYIPKTVATFRLNKIVANQNDAYNILEKIERLL